MVGLIMVWCLLGSEQEWSSNGFPMEILQAFHLGSQKRAKEID